MGDELMKRKTQLFIRLLTIAALLFSILPIAALPVKADGYSVSSGTEGITVNGAYLEGGTSIWRGSLTAAAGTLPDELIVTDGISNFTSSDTGNNHTYVYNRESGIITIFGISADVTISARPVVSSVLVGPASVTITKGTTQQFKAVVSGTWNPSQSVTWRLKGYKGDAVESPLSSGTTISAAGLLTVAADETCNIIIVTAVSTVDTTKSGYGTAAIVAPAAGTISSVLVGPASVTITKGTTQQFKAVVSGSGTPSQSVTWSLKGYKGDAVESPLSSGTTISAAGLLTVAADETCNIIIVTAASTVDTTKSGYGTAAIVAPANYIVSYVNNLPESVSGTLPSEQKFIESIVLSTNQMSCKDKTSSADLSFSNASGSNSSMKVAAAIQSKGTADGWTDGKNHYADGATYSTKANLTLYPNFTFTAAYLPITLPDPGTYPKHVFLGWYDAETGGNRIGGKGDSFTPADAVTIYYAQWRTRTDEEKIQIKDVTYTTDPQHANSGMAYVGDKLIASVSPGCDSGCTYALEDNEGNQLISQSSNHFDSLPESYAGKTILIHVTAGNDSDYTGSAKSALITISAAPVTTDNHGNTIIDKLIRIVIKRLHDLFRVRFNGALGNATAVTLSRVSSFGELAPVLHQQLYGIEAENDQMKVQADGTTVTLKSAYLDTLEPGTYYLTVTYGQVESDPVIFKVQEASQAAAKPALWCITYLDSNGNTVSVQWVETGKAPVKPAGYDYPDIANVSSNQDVRPLSRKMNSRYLVPDTADKG